MARVFISYRRDDARWPARRVYDGLRSRLRAADLFMDVDSIPLGADWREHLAKEVAACDVMLCLIGPGWATAVDPRTGRRRLEDEGDFVRFEVATALERNIPVVPITIDDASLPAPHELPPDIAGVLRRQGDKIDIASFDADLARIMVRLGLLPAEKARAAAAPGPNPPRRPWGMRAWLGAALALALAAAAAWWALRGAEVRPEEVVTAEGRDAAGGTVEARLPDFSSAEEDVFESPEDAHERLVRRVQSALGARGFYVGGVDGAPGPRTRTQAAAFAAADGGGAPPDFDRLDPGGLAALEAFAQRIERSSATPPRREIGRGSYLLCDGDGTIEYLDLDSATGSHTDYFSGPVEIELNGGATGRVHYPNDISPDWEELSQIAVTEKEITATGNIDGPGSAKIRVNRLSGAISMSYSIFIASMSYSGRCEAYDPSTAPRRF